MSPRRILVVDDEPHMLQVLRMFLERAGYRVDTAANGQAALASILRSPPDLLLTDIEMPLMTGLQLCEELEKQLPERAFPVIVMTSLADREHRRSVESMHETIFLEKPLSMRLLTARLTQIFSKPRNSKVKPDA